MRHVRRSARVGGIATLLISATPDYPRASGAEQDDHADGDGDERALLDRRRLRRGNPLRRRARHRIEQLRLVGVAQRARVRDAAGPGAASDGGDVGRELRDRLIALRRSARERGIEHRLQPSREREIVQMLAEGKSNKEIASKLSISVKTVETHRATVMRKLEINSIVELVHYAIRNQLVEA